MTGMITYLYRMGLTFTKFSPTFTVFVKKYIGWKHFGVAVNLDITQIVDTALDHWKKTLHHFE